MVKKHNPRNEIPISLYPLSLEDALKKAMNVKPVIQNQDSLVKYLAGIRINEHRPNRQYDTANNLLKAVMKERWHSMSDDDRNRLIRASGKRLLGIYKKERRTGRSNREAADLAINIELTYLLGNIKPMP